MQKVDDSFFSDAWSEDDRASETTIFTPGLSDPALEEREEFCHSPGVQETERSEAESEAEEVQSRAKVPTSSQETAQDATQDGKKKRSSGPTQMNVEQWLESLRRNDRTFYNMMAMEVWSIAKSMDKLLPGFWSRFMENRQVAVKNFVRDRRPPESGLRLEDLGTPESVKQDHSQN
jgi:hypothetical protein